MALTDTWATEREHAAPRRRASLASLNEAAARRGRRAQARRLNLPGVPPEAAVRGETLAPRARRSLPPQLVESLPPHTLAAGLLAAGADDAPLGLQQLGARRRPRRVGRTPLLVAAGVALVVGLGAILPGIPMAGSGARPPGGEAAATRGQAGDAATGAVPASGLRVSLRTVETNYTVMPGDTLEHIARRFGTTVEALAGMNNLRDVNNLRPGQKLIIP